MTKSYTRKPLQPSSSIKNKRFPLGYNIKYNLKYFKIFYKITKFFLELKYFIQTKYVQRNAKSFMHSLLDINK